MKRHAPVILLIAPFVALAFIESIAAQNKPNGATVLSPDLASVPPDTNLLIAFNLTAYWGGAETESLKRIADAHPVVPTWWFKDVQAASGLQPENIIRMWNFTAGTDAVASITTKQPYDRKNVLAAITPEAEQKTAAGKAYFYSAKSRNAVYLLDDRTLIIGMGDMGHNLAGFLSRPVSRERDASLDRALWASQHGAPFVVHVGPNLVRATAAEKDMRYGPLAPLAQAHAWQIITRIDKQLTVDLRADFATNELADSSVSAFAFVCETLSGQIPFFRSHMVPFLNEQAAQYPGAKDLAPEMAGALDAAAEGLRTLRTNSANNSAGARIEIKTDKPATTTIMLLTLMPRGAKDE